jgi:superfamily II DNA or RNA helicase
MKYKLQQIHIEAIQKEPDKFKKRDLIQDIGIKYFIETKGQLLCTWATATGKTVFALKIIKLLRKQSLGEIHIVLPTNALLEQWQTHTQGIENIKIFIINTYSKLPPQNPLLLIVDECHIGVAKEGTGFANIHNFKPKFRLFLSATLKNEQLRFFQTIGLKDEFHISLQEASLLELVPKFEIYNVYVPFTKQEQLLYKAVTEQESRCKTYFSNFGVDKPLVSAAQIKALTQEPQAVGINFNWLRTRTKRIGLLSNAQNKLVYLRELYPYLYKKTILFSKSIAKAKEIAKLDSTCLLYHSQQSAKVATKNLNAFLESENAKISSVYKLIAGLDDETAECILRESFDSTKQSAVQSLGRILRVDPNNPDKAPMVINFVIEPFDEIIPSDSIWLQIGLRGLDSQFITLPELIQICKQKQEKNL